MMLRPMRATWIITLTAFLASAASQAWAAPKPRRWIVGVKAGVAAAQREAALKALEDLRAKVVKHIITEDQRVAKFEAWVVEAPPSAPAKAALEAKAVPEAKAVLPKATVENSAELAAVQNFLDIEEDVRIKWIEAAEPVSFQALQLPSLGSVMGLVPRLQLRGPPMRALGARSDQVPWGIERVQAPAAWDLDVTGKGTRVAVIDTGIDYEHPDLKGRVLGGFNALTRSDKPADWKDDNGHGTHVAGTIGAARDGGGVVGVAPQAQLYGVKVIDGAGSGSVGDIIDGIVWAINNKMHVANMSLGGPIDSEQLKRAVRYARGTGMVLVVAAGNTEAEVSYPAKYAAEGLCIAVSASDSEDALAPFSSRGPEVTFIAPGKDVVSLSAGNNDFVSYSGTSMAAPHVAGLAAMAVQKGARGLGGPDGVLAALKKAAKSVGLPKEQEGFGMIHATALAR